ncbi:MAG TPA: 50S ribosomal protein L17 [Firmicutes bacterium]|jgi:large subunit ribosomal protein L17|nr:50S ribosomal protein L17 [Bacillota bacterium]
MAYRKLGRRADHRRAMLRNLVTSLLEKERIETTLARGKTVAALAEEMITLAKRGDLHARRQVMSYLLNEDVVKKVFDTTAARYGDRQGGYTRITKIGPRRGDASPMVVVELV